MVLAFERKAGWQCRREEELEWQHRRVRLWVGYHVDYKLLFIIPTLNNHHSPPISISNLNLQLFLASLSLLGQNPLSLSPIPNPSFYFNLNSIQLFWINFLQFCWLDYQWSWVAWNQCCRSIARWRQPD